MPIYGLGGAEPRIHPTAFIHPDAVIIGNVEIGAGSSVWPAAVLRGDIGRIVVGERSSIQDGSVLHCTAELDTVVGDEVTIGHLVHLEGCTIEKRSLVGNGAVVIHRAIVRTGAIVGSNAVVTNDTEVPAGALALGTPAKIRPDAADQGLIDHSVQSYIDRAQLFRAQLRRLD